MMNLDYIDKPRAKSITVHNADTGELVAIIDRPAFFGALFKVRTPNNPTTLYEAPTLDPVIAYIDRRWGNQ